MSRESESADLILKLYDLRREDKMLDAGFSRLVDHDLDERPVDHGQHFLGDRLARRQKAGAQPCDGKHGLANGSSHSDPRAVNAPFWGRRTLSDSRR